jgi:eukaryotic translation initiation factor 2C
MIGMNSQKVPNNIIYYSDGVSEGMRYSSRLIYTALADSLCPGQYDTVVSTELRAIERAWIAVKEYQKKKPGALMDMGVEVNQVRLVAIVGGKRHHARFYPMEKADKDVYDNNNCISGTYIDRIITSPYFEDFYLQSHSGIKGTARPTHYFILANGALDKNCKSVSDLRKLVSYSLSISFRV